LFVLGNLISAAAFGLEWIFTLAEWAIFVRVILSWANADPYNNLVKGLTAVTDPLLAPFRKLLPPWKAGGWDLSPLFAIFVIELLKKFLIPTLYGFSSRLV